MTDKEIDQIQREGQQVTNGATTADLLKIYRRLSVIEKKLDNMEKRRWIPTSQSSTGS